MHRCTNVSGKSLDQLLASCTTLSELRLEGCPRIGAKEILDLSASAVGAGVMSSICVVSHTVLCCCARPFAT